MCSVVQRTFAQHSVAALRATRLYTGDTTREGVVDRVCHQEGLAGPKRSVVTGSRLTVPERIGGSTYYTQEGVHGVSARVFELPCQGCLRGSDLVASRTDGLERFLVGIVERGGNAVGRSAWIAVVLSVLCLGLMASNMWICWTVKTVADRRFDDARQRFSLQLDALRGQTARLSDAVSRLGALADTGRSASPAVGGTDTAAAPSAREAQAELPSDKGKIPDPRSIPLLTEEEKERLRSFRLRMKGLPDEPLQRGDVADKSWNSRGAQLGEEEREQLARALEDYRFFSTVSRERRFKEVVEPELARLREAGAYVEYEKGSPPPAIDGVSISSAEPSPDGQKFRLYYFYPEDYESLYHWARVEEERAWEASVRAFVLINGEGAAEPGVSR